MKIIAELIKWNGEKEEKEIKREWAADMAFAVEGQFFVQNKKNGLSFNGGDSAHILVYYGKYDIENKG